MKIQLLIAVTDSDYVEHFSQVLSEKYADVFEISVCGSAERLSDLLSTHGYTLALLEPSIVEGIPLDRVRLPVILSDGSTVPSPAEAGMTTVQKYQRISKLTGQLLELCAKIAPHGAESTAGRARITAVWSPAGGVGTTTTALAYAARRAADGKRTTYLDLDYFSGARAYFPETGKSISSVLERLDENVELLLRSVRQMDVGSGISYYCRPENYDDMNVLSTQETLALVDACALGMDEVVIDLPGACDERIRRILDLADTVFLVHNSSKAAQAKVEQFSTQGSTFAAIRPKLVLVANQGAQLCQIGLEHVIRLPQVQAGNATAIYKTLSAERFEV